MMEKDTSYSFERDVWSLGICFHVMLLSEFPFINFAFATLTQQLRQWNLFLGDKDSISENAKDLLSKILVKDITKRLTIEEISIHPFFNSE